MGLEHLNDQELDQLERGGIGDLSDQALDRLEGGPPPRAAGRFGYIDLPSERESLEAAGRVITAPGRGAGGALVGLRSLMTGQSLSESAGRAAEAVEPGFEPEGFSEKLAYGAGRIAGSTPAIAALGAGAAAALPMAAGAGLPTTAATLMARGAATFGAMGGLENAAETASQTGELPSASESAKAVAKGSLFGAAVGGAGAVPALVAGRLPAALGKAVTQRLARTIGAGAEAAVGAGAAKLEGGSDEDVAVNSLMLGVLAFLGNKSYDARFKESALNTLVEPVVRDAEASGLPRPQAQAQARATLSQAMLQAVREHPGYQKGIEALSAKIASESPGMPKGQADVMAAQQLEAMAARGDLVGIDELAKIDVKALLKPKAAAAEPFKEPGGQELTAPPPGALEAPKPVEPPPAPLARQPEPGETAILRTPTGEARGEVTGYDPESGEPIVRISEASGDEPPAEVGDEFPVDPSALEFDPAKLETESQIAATAGASPGGLVPAQDVLELTPAEAQARFPQIKPEVLAEAKTAAERALSEAQQEMRAGSEREANPWGVDPVARLIRRAGGIGLEKGLKYEEYGELKAQDMLSRGLIRRGGQIKGFDGVAELMREAAATGEGPSWWADVQAGDVIDILRDEVFRKAGGESIVAEPPGSYGAAPSLSAGLEPWLPERLKSALDISGIKPDSPITSRGFSDDIFGNIRRGTPGQVLAVDLENGVILVKFGPQFSEKYVLADPRNLVELVAADRQWAKAQKVAEPTPAGVRRQAEAATGVKPEERLVKMAESELLREKLRNQSKGAKIGFMAGVRKEHAELMERVKRDGKLTEDIRKKTARLAVDALQGLKVNSTEVGQIAKMIATAKNVAGYYKGLIVFDDVRSKAYRRDLVADIKKVFKRIMGAPGVELDFQRRAAARMAGIDPTKMTELKRGELKEKQAYVEHAQAMGQGHRLPEWLIEEVGRLDKQALKDMAEADLEGLLGDLLGIEANGIQAQDAKEFIHELRKMRLVDQLTADSKPIDDILEPEANPLRASNPEGRIRKAVRFSVNAWNALGRAFTMPYGLMDTLDGGQAGHGPHSRLILEPISAGWRVAQQEYWKAAKPLMEVRDRLNLTPEEEARVVTVFVREQKGGMRRLLGSSGFRKMKPEAAEAEIKGVSLSAREKEAYEAVRKAVDDDAKFKLTAKLIQEVYNRQVKKVPGVYFPFVGLGSESLEEFAVVDALSDEYQGENTYARKKVEAGHTEERTGSGKAIRLDLWETALGHLRRREYLLAMGERLKLIGEAVNTDRYAKGVGQARAKTLRKYITLLTRAGGAEGARDWKILTALRGNVGAYLVGHSVAPVLLNASNWPLIVGQTSFRLATEGLAQAVLPSWRKFMAENLPEYRELDESFQRLHGTARGREGWVGQLSQKSGRLAFYLFMKANNIYNLNAAIAGYRHSLERRGLEVDLAKPDAEALAEASRVMAKTMGSPLYHQMALALSGAVGNREINRAVLQFLTDTIARHNYWKDEVIRNGLGKGNYRDAAFHQFLVFLAWGWQAGVQVFTNRLLYAALLGGAAAKDAYDMDEREKEFLRRTLEGALFDIVPFMAPFYNAGRWKETPIPVLSQGVKASVGLYGVATGSEEKYRGLTAAENALTGLAALTGAVPGGGMVERLVRADRKNQRAEGRPERGEKAEPAEKPER